MIKDYLVKSVENSSISYRNGNRIIAKYLEEQGILEPEEVTFKEKYHQIFWDPNGSPRPRQIIAEWGSMAVAISAIAVGILSLAQEPEGSADNPMLNCNSTTQSKGQVQALLAGGIAYIAANVFATAAVIYYAGPTYRKS